MADATEGPRAMVELVNGERSIVLGLVGARKQGDLAVVDGLLKLQLHAARLGWRVRISECCDEVRELFELMGMADRLE